MAILNATVIIPCHNYGRFLQDAMESVLYEQEDNPINLRGIVVDDGSTDNTQEICNKFKGTIFSILKNESSLGPSPSRNKAITESWDYTDVWFNLDADDMFKGGKVRKFLEVLEDDNIGIVYADYDILNNEGISRREFKEPYNRKRLTEECIIHSGAAFTKKALERVGLKKGDPVYDPSLRFCEDWDLWLKLSTGSLAYHISESLTTVRVHGQNLSYLTPSNQEEWNRSWGVIRTRLQNGNY